MDCPIELIDFFFVTLKPLKCITKSMHKNWVHPPYLKFHVYEKIFEVNNYH